MEQRQFTLICSMHILMIMMCAYADPGYDHLNHNLNRNPELEDSSIIDVDATEPLDSTQPAKPMMSRMGKPSASYADYDYYMNTRRPGMEASSSDNDLSGSSAIRVTSGLETSSHRRPPVDEMNVKSLPWYGQYTGKSLAMYPSRSYDPYIRRYDRFDEQYHRAYPQYFEDMYVHRQRFDPYDSYSPRVPQYPEPYLMYPDRQLDTPQSRDYIKPRRGGYIDEALPMPVLDSYSSSKYPVSANSKMSPQLSLSPRNERVVYYAHLPEIVRTPYDLSLQRTDRNGAGGGGGGVGGAAAALVAPGPYKLNKKKLKSVPRASGDNSTSYKQLF
ncbi:uncharacterized protein LOC117576101 [Drosophila albomicans]|uniref:Uncharacterized protein LOC117576101 n=1 Tax=Drosophila albomicans TaxID=7291 RepID=A0A6P8XT79_DROAB|nr:uncharacterized protein LOC117576101 [Drosophila albomicans]